MAEKKSKPPRQIGSEHILTGLLFCGKCGKPMRMQRPGNLNKKKFRYYACNGRLNTNSCDQEYINANTLESSILGQVEKFSQRPERIKDYIISYKRRKTKDRSALLKEIKTKGNELEQLKQEQEEIGVWLTSNRPEDRKTINRVSKQISAFEDKIEAKEDEVCLLQIQVQNINVDDMTLENIAGYLQNFKFYYERLEKAQKKLLFETVVRKVIVNSKEDIFVKFTLPFDSESRELRQTAAGDGSSAYPFMKVSVKTREMFSTQIKLSTQLEKLERKVTKHDKEIEKIFEAVRQLLSIPPKEKNRKIGFD